MTTDYSNAIWYLRNAARAAADALEAMIAVRTVLRRPVGDRQ